jgi:hypothetical protein
MLPLSLQSMYLWETSAPLSAAGLTGCQDVFAGRSLLPSSAATLLALSSQLAQYYERSLAVASDRQNNIKLAITATVEYETLCPYIYT